MGGLVLVRFIFVLAVRYHAQDLVSVRLAIDIFQEFSDVVGIASSTQSAPFVDDT